MRPAGTLRIQAAHECFPSGICRLRIFAERIDAQARDDAGDGRGYTDRRRRKGQRAHNDPHERRGRQLGAALRQHVELAVFCAEFVPNYPAVDAPKRLAILRVPGGETEAGFARWDQRLQRKAGLLELRQACLEGLISGGERASFLLDLYSHLFSKLLGGVMLSGCRFGHEYLPIARAIATKDSIVQLGRTASSQPPTTPLAHMSFHKSQRLLVDPRPVALTDAREPVAPIRNGYEFVWHFEAGQRFVHRVGFFVRHVGVSGPVNQDSGRVLR